MEIKKRVLIRADGGPEIGLGHLVRCSALAHMLKDDFCITFFCKEIPDTLADEFVAGGFGLKKIETEEEYIQELKPNQIAVLDVYGFNTDYQRKIKATGAKLVCIDDLHDKEYLADLIINHAPGISPKDYKAQPYTLFALGPEYALLRPAFLEQAKKERKIEKIETLLIAFGGADPIGFTEKTVKVAIQFPEFRKIIVVTGASFTPGNRFAEMIASDYRIEQRINLKEKEMLSTMLEADLAIVPSSGVLFETLAAGCKTISGYCVDNQKLTYEGFLKEGVIIDSGSITNSEITTALKEALESTCLTQKVIDGFSGQRIFKKFLNLAVNIRSVTADDCDLLFNWVNRKDVRNNAVKPDLIPYKDHLRWFDHSLNSKTTNIYIMELENRAIGQVRFDLKDGYYFIDYFLDEGFRGLGLGKTILQKTMQYNQMKNLRAIVKEDNIASGRTFISLGFRPVSSFTNINGIFITYELHQDY